MKDVSSDSKKRLRAVETHTVCGKTRKGAETLEENCRSAVFVRAAAEASSKLKKKPEKLGQEQAELQSLRLECYDLGQEFFHQQISVYD